MLLTCRAVYEGETPPRFYGIAYDHPDLRAAVYYLLPFNLFVRWWRGFWFWLVAGRGNRWERALHEAHAVGFKAGRDAMIASMEAEFEKPYPGHKGA